jgi:glutamate synthase (NADPH/NADH) large chain
LAAGVLEQFDSAVNDFVRVLPRDYAAVRDLRRDAVATGLDPDGETVWNRILEVTGG